jgi:hypothetical protein
MMKRLMYHALSKTQTVPRKRLKQLGRKTKGQKGAA